MQVAERLRTDPRVVVVDRTNLRYLQLQDLPGDAVPVDLISLDLSFISVLKVMPVVCELLQPGGTLIVLVKPQFEASREQVTHTRCFAQLARMLWVKNLCLQCVCRKGPHRVCWAMHCDAAASEHMTIACNHSLQRIGSMCHPAIMRTHMPHTLRWLF